MNIAFRSLMVLAAGALVIGATACSSSPKAPEETAASTTPAPAIEEAAPAPVQAPTLAQNDSKTKGLWGASSTGRSR